MVRPSPRAQWAAALLILVSPLAHGQGRAADLGALLTAFFEAVDPLARQAAIAAIRAAAPDPRDVERGLRQGRSYPAAASRGWQIYTHTGSDGKVRPYHVYIPKGYDPARKHPAIVQLHGGVSRTNLVPEAALTQIHADVKDADQYGWIQIIPLGQRGATWFDRVGMANILAQLAAVKRRYNVDEDRVFLGGFSDGGSGALILGLFYPTPWAGLISLSGSITVALAAPDEAFPANLSNRPVHAANGGIDPLYPSALQKIFIDQLREQNVRIAWTDYPASGHDDSYRAEEDPKSNQFVLKTARDPSPRHVLWETANSRVGRCDWVRIDEVRDVGNNQGPEPSNLVVVGPPLFALHLDQGFAGPGVRIKQVLPGSLAQNAGLKSDDVLTRLDGVAIKTLADAQKVILTRILSMKQGDMVRGEYRRGAANHSFGFPVPELPRVPLFKRTLPAGRVEVKATGNRIDVTARAVARYTLLIRREMFDLDRPIQLFTNGAESFNDRVKPDLDFLLEQAGEDDDRSAVYIARIEIQVLPGATPGRP